MNGFTVRHPLLTPDENQCAFSLDISRSGNADGADCKVGFFNTLRSDFASQILDGHNVHDPQGAVLIKGEILAEDELLVLNPTPDFTKKNNIREASAETIG